MRRGMTASDHLPEPSRYGSIAGCRSACERGQREDAGGTGGFIY